MAIAWPISNHVSGHATGTLQSLNQEIAEAAVASRLERWHLVSLALSFVTIFLAGLALCYAVAVAQRVTVH